ncbi:MAG: TonB-dependent receptor, partial [Sphingomonadales bacterium]
IDLRAVADTGGIEHTIVLGASALWEKYTLATGNVLRNADRTLVYSAYPLINIANPNVVVPGPAGFNYGSNVYTGPVNVVQNSGQQGEVSNYAVYLFDTMKLGKFELSGGVRWEKNKGQFRSDTAGAAATLTTPQGPITRGIPASNDAEMLSYRAALAYKPVEAVTLYASYGNSKAPSQSSVNGSCVATGASTTCNVKPEGAKIYEIGAKAELSGGRLLVSASAFRNERDSYRVASGDPLIADQQLDGHSRVDGIALSVVGKITPAWSITANYTYLDGELLQSVSDYCLANPSTACGNSTANRDPGKGAELQNTPKHSGSLFTTYELPFGLRLGYGVTYQ